MEGKISVIIPLRNKSLNRVNKVISRLQHPLVSEILIVDYGSAKEFVLKDDKVKVIRYKKKGIWNKAHAINIGAKEAVGDYLMTLDADIMIGPELFDKIADKLSKDAFIYTNKVCRIKMDDISTEWEETLAKSTPWHPNAAVREEAFNIATGGFQLFPKEWFYKNRGLDENLIYYGGMDNVTVIQARRDKLNLIIMNETILHIEHQQKKELNLPEPEREFAEFVRNDRWNLIEHIVKTKVDPEKDFGSLYGPNSPLVNMYRQEFKKVNKVVKKEARKEVNVEMDGDMRIMIAVINNKSYLPELFVRDLIALYIYTKTIFPNTKLSFVKSCQVNNMRNMAVQNAIKGEFDYLICLDDDHKYPRDTIIKLLAHQKDFVTGCTRQRIAPYHPTQFYKFINPIRQTGNFVFSDGRKSLEKIECSGPVGMLMKVSKLKKLKYPYYKMDYEYDKENYLGGDYYFCRQLLQNEMVLWLDLSLDFPHMINGLVDGVSDTMDANVRLDDGTF